MKKYWWISILTMLVDQAVKALARSLGGAVTLIPGVLRFTFARNTGMAFSLLSGNSWGLGVVSILCIIAGWILLRRYQMGPVSRLAAALMLGGAVGNMLDRLLLGYVVDMFETLFMDFAIFNVADAALTVGTAIMAVSLVCRPDEWRKRDGNT